MRLESNLWLAAAARELMGERGEWKEGGRMVFPARISLTGSAGLDSQFAKRCFEEGRSQAEAWERVKDEESRLGEPRYGGGWLRPFCSEGSFYAEDMATLGQSPAVRNAKSLRINTLGTAPNGRFEVAQCCSSASNEQLGLDSTKQECCSMLIKLAQCCSSHFFCERRYTNLRLDE
jgi:hypothetical protein